MLPMRRTFLAFVVAVLPGCAYMQDRGKDFVEIWRGDAGFGIGGLAEVRVGDVVHAGAGAALRLEIGASYGAPMMAFESEAIIGPVHVTGPGGFHGQGGPAETEICWQTPPCQHCFGVLRVLTNPSVRTWLHRFDLEVRVCALVSIDVGFSPGEFVDFIVGWFGVDLDPPHQDPPPDWKSGIPGPFAKPPREKWPDEEKHE